MESLCLVAGGMREGTRYLCVVRSGLTQGDQHIGSIGRRDGGSAPSLGLIKPRDVRLTVEVNPNYAPLDRAPVQTDLFGHETDLLEESPVIAKFRYKCASSQCGGHQQTLIDWESGQLARRNRPKGPHEMVRLHRERFLDQMCGAVRDTHFYVGNMHQHPTDFLVLGLWSPPAVIAAQGMLVL